MWSVFLLVAGILGLMAGAELIVKNGTALARRLHISPLIIGLTVVSIGTSIPELVVGIDGMSRGVGDVVLGNIVGTNIVNMLLVFGVLALIRPVAIRSSTLRLDLPAMTVFSLLVWLLALGGFLTLVDGAILLAVGLLYLAVVIVTARRRSVVHPGLSAAELAEAPAAPPRPGRWWAWLEIGLLAVGLAVIVLGSDWMLDGAVGIAETLGVPNYLIGLTIVAIGTSAPELATALAATIRNHDPGIAVGNLIGSSALNPTLILGASLLFGPSQTAVAPSLRLVSMPLMVVVALALVPIFLSGKKVSRGEGLTMVVAYLVYLAYLIVSAT
ncbi:MAG: calcium/sodium antiporter [Promicromonosporaceae bacterium]|nr:calcium/sodium antiporter [Promicromonosporaceae bacterium]